MMFTWYREFVTTPFSRYNRLFQVHFPKVEGERRGAFPLRSERTRKEVKLKKITSDLLCNICLAYMFCVDGEQEGKSSS